MQSSDMVYELSEKAQIWMSKPIPVIVFEVILLILLGQFRGGNGKIVLTLMTRIDVHLLVLQRNATLAVTNWTSCFQT